MEVKVEVAVAIYRRGTAEQNGGRVSSRSIPRCCGVVDVAASVNEDDGLEMWFDSAESPRSINRRHNEVNSAGNGAESSASLAPIPPATTSISTRNDADLVCVGFPPPLSSIARG
ncbi:unnamed protein product [Linum trigynum]|uniref:Uncharacterized protein n=1 Tax=Linum trigynum TaxID=586398 RepID=A0AAV2FQI2_9ROSI